MFGFIAMVDFWRWEYNYGHNLDPNAAIIVPGMAYQPPLIGFKQLLNFGAYSVPDRGGWIFMSAGIILLGCTIMEWMKRKKNKPELARRVTFSLLMLLLTYTFSGCNPSPEPIVRGKDNCTFCKMTISDNRFGAEIVTKKSKVYKFDDSHCIMAFLHGGTVAHEDIQSVYFTNFTEPHQLIDAKRAYFLQSPSLKSPMNGNIAAFDHEDSLDNMIPKFYGNKTTWEQMQK